MKWAETQLGPAARLEKSLLTRISFPSRNLSKVERIANTIIKCWYAPMTG